MHPQSMCMNEVDDLDKHRKECGPIKIKHAQDVEEADFPF